MKNKFGDNYFNVMLYFSLFIALAFYWSIYTATNFYTGLLPFERALEALIGKRN